MAKRTKGTEPESEPTPAGRLRKTMAVHVSADLAKKINVIAHYRDVSVTAIVDPLVKDWVNDNYKIAIREMAKELDG